MVLFFGTILFITIIFLFQTTVWMCMCIKELIKVESAILFIHDHAFFPSVILLCVLFPFPSSTNCLFSLAPPSFYHKPLVHVKVCRSVRLHFLHPYELISASARFCCNHPEHSEKTWPQKSITRNHTYFPIWELRLQDKYTKFIDLSSFRMWKAS